MEPITKSVTELELANGACIFIAPLHAKDVVTVYGSLLGGSNMVQRNKADVQSIVVELLDAGTAKKSKDQIREAMGARGISLTFSAGGDRTYFSGSCLPEDLGALLNTLVECLNEASFPAKEISAAKERMLGELQDLKTDTSSQAARALSRMIYDPSHINYPDTIDTQIKNIKDITRADLVSFRKLLGSGGLVLAITGDITASKTEKLVRASVAKLSKGTSVIPPKKINTKKHTQQEQLIPINDKANIDTYFGAITPLTIDHPLYRAFFVFSNMLAGGGLSVSHLTQTIRERDGLTYAIRARSFGFSDGSDGAFRIWALFSPGTFKKAVQKTRDEISIFLKTKLTADELLKIQDRLTGSYVVGLSTTEGLASVLHSIGVEGKQLSYIDAYPDLIRAVTLDDLRAVAKLIPFNKLSLAASGTFDTKAK
jgi:zinc protease